MPDTPEVHPNNTAYMFGTVDTAHGSNGQGLATAAPHLFGETAAAPPPFEHMPHAVEFQSAELATAAAHMPGGVTTAVEEAATIAATLARASRRQWRRREGVAHPCRGAC
jgi:hypothetical protein